MFGHFVTGLWPFREQLSAPRPSEAAVQPRSTTRAGRQSIVWVQQDRELTGHVEPSTRWSDPSIGHIEFVGVEDPKQLVAAKPLEDAGVVGMQAQILHGPTTRLA